MLHRAIGFLSCLVELFTDRRAPEVGRCYQLDTRVKKAFLREVPNHHTLNGPILKGCAIDPQASGSLLVIRLHGTNGPTWDQWVQCIYCNDKDVQYKGWLP